MDLKRLACEVVYWEELLAVELTVDSCKHGSESVWGCVLGKIACDRAYCGLV